MGIITIAKIHTYNVEILENCREARALLKLKKQAKFLEYLKIFVTTM